ncbi:MAG: metallophosphoesterase family protein [Thermoplasmataceae archaeon]
MRALRIVHLSDLHLSKSNSYETNMVLQSLVPDIKNRLRDLDSADTYIAISGDLTYSGTSEEFELLRDFTNRLKVAANTNNVIFAPGNHDLCWSSHPLENADLMDDLVERGSDGIVKVERRFQSPIDRSLLLAGMSTYYDFTKSIGQDFSEYLYSLHSLKMERFKVNFISLNSAFLFSKKFNYYGYIGKMQLERATAESDARGDFPEDFRVFNIMIFHHPFEAIVPASQIETENLVKSRADLILNGHVHNLRVYVDLTSSLIGGHNTRGHPIISGSRAVYDEVNDPNVVPGYSVIDVMFDDASVKGFRIYEIRYDKGRRSWYRDPNNPNYPFVLNFPIEEQNLPQEDEQRLIVCNLMDIRKLNISVSDMVRKLVELDYKSMPGLVPEDEGTLDQWIPIFTYHPYTWRVLLNSSNAVIGYWHVVSLFDEYYERIKKGKLYEIEISEDMISPMELPGHYNIYFRSIALEEDFRGTEASHLLLESFFSTLTELAKKSIFIDEICANAYTPAGKALCKNFDLMYIGEHTPKGSLYYRKMYPLPKSPLVNEHPELVRIYGEEFGRN